MKKILQSRIIFFVLGLLLSGSVAYAITINSADITYDNSRSGLKDENNNDVDNVKDAIDVLYGKTLNAGSSSGPTKESAQTNITHKGVVYLDPTNLSRTCNEANSTSTSETKEGCMKWYIYNDSGSTYKLILDHNTTARIKWNDNNVNVSYDNSNLKTVVDSLKTVNHWVVNPTLITTDEIVAITGKTGFSSSNANTWYYLDTNSQTRTSFNANNRSKYDWLTNNLYKCKTDSTDYGCTVEDNKSYDGYGTASGGVILAYWTRTTVGNAESGSNVWYIDKFGDLGRNNANLSDIGIRPVIEVSKSIFN